MRSRIWKSTIVMAILLISTLVFAAASLKISATISDKDLDRGDEGTITATITVPKNHYLYLENGDSPYVLKIKSNNSDIIEIDGIKLPEGKKIDDNVRILSGTFDAEIDFTVLDDSPVGNKTLKFTVEYQLCNKKDNMCLVPSKKVFNVKVQISE